MKSPPILNQANQDPEVEVAEARAAGESIIRGHLDNHLAHNMGASSDYISWIATLHPENAQIEIDQRFFVPGNPWWSIYEETVNTPYATAVPVPAADEEMERQSKTQHDATSEEDVKYISSTTTQASDDLTEEETPPAKQTEHPQDNRPHYCLRCSPVDTFVGVITTFHAILITLILEFTAIIFYFVAAFFYHIAQAIGPNNMFTGFFYCFFMVMYFTFATVDSALLLGSVLGAETCSFVGWIVGCLFGGIWVANKRHQFVRRVCHRIRWAFRHKHLEPPRTFCKQSQVGTELEAQHQDSTSPNAGLDREFEVDDYEAQHRVEATHAQHHDNTPLHHEETPAYAPAQAKDDLEPKSVKPY
ncbi:MAG: hypothetical protein SGBAC_003903 [Bacillariaceae sp.]